MKHSNPQVAALYQTRSFDEEMSVLVDSLPDKGSETYDQLAKRFERPKLWVVGRMLEAERRGLVTISRYYRPAGVIKGVKVLRFNFPPGAGASARW